MNSTGAWWTRSGLSLFAVGVAIALGVLLASLFFADRRIRAGTSSEIRLDAQESAALVASTLRVEWQSLAASAAARAVGAGADGSTREGIVPALLREQPALDTVWLWDSTGTLVAYGARAATRAGAPAVAALRSATEAAPLRGVGAPGSIQLSPAGNRPDGIRVTVPVTVAGRPAGTVRGAYRADRLFAPVLAVRTADDAAMVLRVGTDTILENGTPSDHAQRLSVPVTLVTGDRWELEVAHSSTSNALRISLWAMGLLAIAVLAIGGVREHNDRIRIASRSAELERLSSELLRSNRMKSEFLANVSHELRTPLNAIVGFIDLLRDGVYGELTPRQAAPVERIAASAGHLRQLVDQVLDIAKIAAGRLEVHPEPLALRTFIVNLASELEPLVNEKSLTLSISISSVPRVRTDPSHLRQILVNLIGNAVKYTQAGGISVRARLLGDKRSLAAVGREDAEDPLLLARAPGGTGLWVAIQVIDSGIGIASQDSERIFDEFEQVDAGPRTNSAQRGTGLGLAISRRLARLLGGDLTVESEVGQGSTFTLWLPVRGTDVQLAGRPSGPMSSIPGVSGGRST